MGLLTTRSQRALYQGKQKRPPPALLAVSGLTPLKTLTKGRHTEEDALVLHWRGAGGSGRKAKKVLNKTATKRRQKVNRRKEQTRQKVKLKPRSRKTERQLQGE